MTNLEKILLTTVIGTAISGIGVAVNAIVQAKKDIQTLEGLEEQCKEIASEINKTTK